MGSLSQPSSNIDDMDEKSTLESLKDFLKEGWDSIMRFFKGQRAELMNEISPKNSILNKVFGWLGFNNEKETTNNKTKPNIKETNNKLPSGPLSRETINSFVGDLAPQFGLNAENASKLANVFAHIESGHNPSAHNGSGAMGLLQYIPRFEPGYRNNANSVINQLGIQNHPEIAKYINDLKINVPNDNDQKSGAFDYKFALISWLAWLKVKNDDYNFGLENSLSSDQLKTVGRRAYTIWNSGDGNYNAITAAIENNDSSGVQNGPNWLEKRPDNIKNFFESERVQEELRSA